MKNSFKILSFGDLEAVEQNLNQLIKNGLNSFDLIIYTGDTPNPAIFKILSKQLVEKGLGDMKDKPNIARETEPLEALKKVEDEFWSMKRIFEKIYQTGKFFGVWGNADNTKILANVPIQNFINNLHNKVVKWGDYFLIGYNGRPLYIFEKENREQWAFAEDGAERNLEKIFKKIDPNKVILITHAPPFRVLDQVEKNYRKYAIGTYGEKAKDGHIGSIAFRKIVEKYQPFLHIFGHIHESKGVRRIGKTICVNTGCLGGHGEYATTSIDSNNEVMVQFNRIDQV